MDTWVGQIRENAILWQDPYSKVEFDIRCKTKPSKNALSSIYSIVYHKNAGKDIASLSCTNLKALIVVIILNKEDIDFKSLQEYYNPYKK